MPSFPVDPGWRGAKALESREGLWSSLRRARLHVRCLAHESLQCHSLNAAVTRGKSAYWGIHTAGTVGALP